MKNRNFQKIIIILLAGLGMMEVSAQDNTVVQNVMIEIPEVAMLDLEGGQGKDIRFAPERPTEAGLPVDFNRQSNTDLWINYSSIVNRRTEPSRDIKVQITSGKIPAGMVLQVKAGQDAGRGDGKTGAPAGTINLDATAQSLITGVGSAYTGNGKGSGHQLTYRLALSDENGAYSKLDLDESASVSIMYTLTDQ